MPRRRPRVVAARRSARNGLCSAPEPPRRLPSPGGPGRWPAPRRTARAPRCRTAGPSSSRVREVERRAHRAAHGRDSGAPVRDPHRPRDDGHAREDRGGQGDHDAARRIDEVDLERVRLVVRLHVGRGEAAAERRLARDDPVSRVAQVEHGGPIRGLHDQPRDPEVAHARTRQRQPDRLADPVVVPGERRRQVAVRRARRPAARRRGGARSSRSRGPPAPSWCARCGGATRASRGSRRWSCARRLRVLQRLEGPGPAVKCRAGRDTPRACRDRSSPCRPRGGRRRG